MWTQLCLRSHQNWKRYTSGPRYWNVPVLVNTGTFLVYQYCLKMWCLRSLERDGVIQKLTILERIYDLVLSNTCVPVSGTWSILFPQNFYEIFTRKQFLPTSAGSAQAQLHFQDDQQRVFRISNISNSNLLSLENYYKLLSSEDNLKLLSLDKLVQTVIFRRLLQTANLQKLKLLSLEITKNCHFEKRRNVIFRRLQETTIIK